MLLPVQLLWLPCCIWLLKGSSACRLLEEKSQPVLWGRHQSGCGSQLRALPRLTWQQPSCQLWSACLTLAALCLGVQLLMPQEAAASVPVKSEFLFTKTENTTVLERACRQHQAHQAVWTALPALAKMYCCLPNAGCRVRCMPEIPVYLSWTCTYFFVLLA